MTRNDCAACGHDPQSHNDGTCHVTAVGTRDGVTRYPGGCGCTAMPFDAICTTCGKPYVCALGHEPHECLACYNAAKAERDAASFGPLIDALNARNIPVSPSDIWNTGGNVMCLPLPVTEDPSGPYVMWSDDAEYIGFGIYPDTDHPGLFASPADVSDVTGDESRPQESYSWAYRDNAERAADFAMRAIPEVVRWLAEDVTIEATQEPDRFTGGTYTYTTATYDRLPVIADAIVEDFNA